MTSSILASISTLSLAWLPAMVRGRPEPEGGRSRRPSRGRTVRVPDERTGRHSNLFVPAGAGPHPVLLMDAADQTANLRAEAHRFASIGIAAFFRDADDLAADPAGDDVAQRVGYIRARGDINPHELGALCFGNPNGWLDDAAANGVSFLIRVSLHENLPVPALTRESMGPHSVPLLDVLALRAPLAPEATRLVDAWLLRHVTIRS